MIRRRTTTGLGALLAAATILTALPAASGAPTDGTDHEAAGVDACRPAAAVDGLGAGFPVDDQAIPATGTVHATTVFVDFSDAPAGADTLGAAGDNLRSGVDYLEDISGGRLALQVAASDSWVRMPEPSTAYPFERGLTYAEHVRYIEDAVAAADPSVDFSDTDVVWVVATAEAEAISYSPTTNFLDVTVDGNRLTHAVTIGADQWSWGGLVLAHESGHTFGLPDLYLTEAPADDPGNHHAAVGGWDLMGLISGHAPELFTWSRWQLGWIDDEQVVCADGTTPSSAELVPVPATASADASQDAMLVLPVGATTAVVVENRQRTGYDDGALATGALVYTVDTSVRSGDGPLRVVDATPGSAAGLDDAPFGPGDRWTEPTTGATLTFATAEDQGSADGAPVLTVTVEPDTSATPPLDLDTVVQPRCLGGRGFLAVRVQNGTDVPVSVTVDTPYGTRTVEDVAPDRYVHRTFGTRSPAVPAGTVSVTGHAVVGGEDVTSTEDVPFEAFTCD
ncbi:M6 family metalloprotease domain-containing protein [Isoptericola haloaureus]|uniref:M6 family metalloprotease domain-containing protein n=1 Tax=Isoptericola haloaureus TaxID=1542902 RepID=A0ABU7Z4K0_9MICO